MHGFCAKLLLELRAEVPELYRNFIHMSSDQFDYLLKQVKPHIEKSNTKMRVSIPADERLALTLYHLVIGENFRSLQYLFRISQISISRIIPEVLDAIGKVLVADFIKVNTVQYFIAQRDLTQRMFNYRLSRTRRIIENVCSALCQPVSPVCRKNKESYVLVCSVLHSFLMGTNKAASSSAFDIY